MVKSMTGYGKGEFENQLYKFKVEIKAVNHRYNDILVKMPRHIAYMEEIIKKKVRSYIKRGKIDVYVYLEYINDSSIDIHIDKDLAQVYKSSLEELISKLKMEERVRLNNILALPEIVQTQRKEIEEDLMTDSLEGALKIALDNLIDMRKREGRELKKDIHLKLDKIESYLSIIQERSPLVIEDYKNKLKQRIKEILENHTVLDEERLNNEVAYFIDKSNIDEELVRLASHVKQFKIFLEEEEAIGRKLDFLIQEFNREINTIGSKSNDKIITSKVIELKAELEKIREQVQNIE